MFFSEEEKKLLTQAVEDRITKLGKERNRLGREEDERQVLAQDIDHLVQLYCRFRDED